MLDVGCLNGGYEMVSVRTKISQIRATENGKRLNFRLRIYFLHNSQKRTIIERLNNAIYYIDSILREGCASGNSNLGFLTHK